MTQMNRKTELDGKMAVAEAVSLAFGNSAQHLQEDELRRTRGEKGKQGKKGETNKETSKRKKT